MRTILLVFAFTVAAAVLLSVLAVLAVVLGLAVLAAGSGGSVAAFVLAAVARRLSGPSPPTP